MPQLSSAAVPQHVAILMDGNRRRVWPDFSASALDDALPWFGARDRRFGASSALPAC